MDALEPLFIYIFLIVYTALRPIFNDPNLTIYTVILIGLGALTWKNYRWIIRHKSGKKSGNGKYVFWARVGAELYLVLFLLWLMLFHFHTFKRL